MIRVRVRVKVWVSVKYYAIKVVPESFRIHYRPPEIKKGESPKSCSNCKRKDTLFQNVLEINNESISQDFIACNALKDPLMPIVIENAI
jgi:hypothetical protein